MQGLESNPDGIADVALAYDADVLIGAGAQEDGAQVPGMDAIDSTAEAAGYRFWTLTVPQHVQPLYKASNEYSGANN